MREQLPADDVEVGVSSTVSGWANYVNRLVATRPRTDTTPPLRAMAEELVLRALALLFTQFARDLRMISRESQTDPRKEAEAFEILLRDVLTVVSPAERAQVVAAEFLNALPSVHDLLEDDAMAILAGDPAAASRNEVIQAYPGFLGIAVHRLAHEFYTRNVPVLPRLLSEWAHRNTGIDIHPGATIGRSFAIDHGTGVVIGETSVIGTGVRVYQGVTLGALAVSKQLAHKKRHPTIGDDVVLYANATILGGSTVVGNGSIIGGNVWLTHSVPPRSIVQFSSRVEQRSADGDGLEFHI
ncbi:MAG: serine acetyltransferase [Gemmatimonadota bacterium]|nr:serine acetyltransferase [Gemmatimonadota bacterium]